MRKTRPIAAALLLTLAPAGVPRVARAQNASEDPTTAMARARFKEGVEFYDKGEFEQARISFLQTYALKKHPAVLLNLAWSCIKSGHALEADKYFKQFLAEGKDITDKQRSDANDGLTQTRARLGRIEVAAAAGTEVSVDGERVGNAPFAEPVMVEIGAHTVKFKASDGTTDTLSITVMGGEKVVARFKPTSTAPAAVGPAPPPSAATTPTPEATPPSPAPAKHGNPAAEEGAGNAEAGERPKQPGTVEAEGKSIFAPPKNLVPVYILAGVAVGLYAGAGLLAYFRDQAQGKADDLKAQITSPANRGGCNPVSSARFVDACNAWQTDIGQANDDATWANVLLGFGIAATAGLVVYWFIADKHDDAPAVAGVTVTPIVGPGTTGASLSAHF
jgi:hypothetical protein